MLLIELKHGNSAINFANYTQAAEYARAIGKSGKIHRDGKIVAYVLGTTLGDVEDGTIGEHIEIRPRTYSTVLKMAKSRTFYLKKKIEEAQREVVLDELAEDVVLARISNDKQ